MNTKHFIIRFVAATIIALVVFIISVLVVWRASSDTLMNNHNLPYWTTSTLRKIDLLIQERIEQEKSPPMSLRDITQSLLGETFPNSSVKIIKNGVPVDGWGRPFQYSVQGTSYTLISYGRDGLPGGSGFDCDFDLFNNDPSIWDDDYFYNPPMPTLRQFLFELPSKGMLQSCILSAVIAFIASFLIINPTAVSKKSAIRLGTAILATILASVFFACMIMQLHIPTGH